LCFFLNGDLTQKQGQIAHVDHDSSNSEEENLAFLCFAHHNLYDRKDPQLKGISADVLRHARADLYNHLASEGAAQFVVVLRLKREFDDFGKSDAEKVLQAVQQVLQNDERIDLISVRRGSVVLRVRLNGRQLAGLLLAQEKNALDSVGIVEVEIEKAENDPMPVVLAPSYLTGISHYLLSRSALLAVLSTPDSSQHFFAGNEVPESQARCSLYVKRLKPHLIGEDFTALVISGLLGNTRLASCALRLYDAEVRHSRTWSPADMLRAFLEIYGVDESYEQLGTKRVFRGVSVNLPPHVITHGEAAAYVLRLCRHPSGQRPGDVEFVNVNFFDREHRRLFIELAFAFSCKRYAVSLVRHNLHFPSEFFF